MDETAQTRRAALRIANFCRSPMISASIPSVVESGILRLSHSTGFVGEKVRLRGRECRAPTSYLLRGHAPAPTASGAPRDLSGGQQLFQLQSSRSEEHTSELQSLMRISYAVFCLKKKKHSYDIENNKQRAERYNTSTRHKNDT